MNFKSFSQTDTNLKVILKEPIARLVIKDIIKGENAQKQLEVINEKVEVLQTKIFIQDSIINNLSQQNLNYKNIIINSQNKFDITQKYNKRLEKELKKARIQNKLYSYGGGIIVVGLTTFLIFK